MSVNGDVSEQVVRLSLEGFEILARLTGSGAKNVAAMIYTIMKDKNIDSLEDLIKLAQDNGVELIACSMSMDVMGIKQEELIDGVTLSGVATMLANGEESDMSLFI